MIDIEAFNAFVSELSNYNYYKEQYKKQKEKIDDMYYLASGCRGVDPSKEHAESYNMPFIEEMRLQGVDDREAELIELNRLKLNIMAIDQKLNGMPQMIKNAYINIYIKHKTYASEASKLSLTLAKLKYLMQSQFQK